MTVRLVKLATPAHRNDTGQERSGRSKQSNYDKRSKKLHNFASRQNIANIVWTQDFSLISIKKSPKGQDSTTSSVVICAQ